MKYDYLKDRARFEKQHPEQMFTVNGRRWRAIVAGSSGPALVLIPGTLGRAAIFWQQIEKLSARARVLSLTYPANHDIDAWAGDLTTLLDRCSMNRATLLGSSLGGYLAQYFAAKYPDRLDGLIAANTLSSTAGFDRKPPYSTDIANTSINLLREGFVSGMTARARSEPEYQAMTELLITEVEGGIPAQHLKARLLALKNAPAIPRIKVDAKHIAVIEAEDDPLIDHPTRDTVRKFLLPAVTYRFKHGGHFPYIVRPDAYLSILEERLGLEPTGANWGQGEVRSL